MKLRFRRIDSEWQHVNWRRLWVAILAAHVLMFIGWICVSWLVTGNWRHRIFEGAGTATVGFIVTIVSWWFVKSRSPSPYSDTEARRSRLGVFRWINGIFTNGPRRATSRNIFDLPCSTVDIVPRINVEYDPGELDGLVAEVVVNGVTLSSDDYGPLDLLELRDSLLADGTYFIFTCECGCAGCAGRMKGIVVTHDYPLVAWADGDMPDNEWVFVLEDAKAALQRAIGDAQMLIQRTAATVDIVPEQNSALLLGKQWQGHVE